jgi:hypothetical protein
LIAEAVDGLQETLGEATAVVMSAIDEQVQRREFNLMQKGARWFMQVFRRRRER